MGDTWLEGIMQKQSMAEKPTLGGQLPDQALEVLTARKRIAELESALAKSASREAALVEAIGCCYRMLISEADTRQALFKAENILRNAIAKIKSKEAS